MSGGNLLSIQKLHSMGKDRLYLDSLLVKHGSVIHTYNSILLRKNIETF